MVPLFLIWVVELTMKTVRAYNCIRDGGRDSAAKPGNVVFLLDETHAAHTLRTFLRDQGESAVLEPMSEADASRLLAGDTDDETPATLDPAA
jgi:hypothetical protein